MRFPVDNAVITSKYGLRTLQGKSDFHPGWDLISRESAKVYAVTDGIVVYDMDDYDDVMRWTDQRHSVGNFLIIQHKINGKIYYGRYFHLGFNNKKVGDLIKEGDYLGDYGDYGYSFGAHVHIDFWNAVWQKNEYGTTVVDPKIIFEEVGK